MAKKSAKKAFEEENDGHPAQPLSADAVMLAQALAAQCAAEARAILERAPAARKELGDSLAKRGFADDALRSAVAKSNPDRFPWMNRPGAKDEAWTLLSTGYGRMRQGQDESLAADLEEKKLECAKALAEFGWVPGAKQTAEYMKCFGHWGAWRLALWFVEMGFAKPGEGLKEALCALGSWESLDRIAQAREAKRLAQEGKLLDAPGYPTLSDYLFSGCGEIALELARLGWKWKPLDLRAGDGGEACAGPAAAFSRGAWLRSARDGSESDCMEPVELFRALLAAGMPVREAQGGLDFRSARNADPMVALFSQANLPPEAELEIAATMVQAGYCAKANGGRAGAEILAQWRWGDEFYSSEQMRRGLELLRGAGAEFGGAHGQLLLAGAVRGRRLTEKQAAERIGLAREFGADPKSAPARGEYYGCALANAVRFGRHKAALGFLKMGAPAAWEDEASGQTLLHWCAELGSSTAMALLAALLADPQAHAQLEKKDVDGRTPLALAAFKLSFAAAKLLLAAGADPNAPDAKGDRPLHLACRRSGIKAEAKALKTVELLLEGGADPLAVNGKGLRCAQMLAGKGPLSALRPLLEADPMAVGGEGEAARVAAQKLERRGLEALSLAESAKMRSLDLDAGIPGKSKGGKSKGL